MSEQSLKRIKQIKQRDQISNTYTSYPLGVDGLLVDMMSNLDLEEDLKIGNNHYVQIKDDNQYDTTITEYYFSQSRVQMTPSSTTIRSIDDMMTAGLITHMVEIQVKSSVAIEFLSLNDDQTIIGPGQNTDYIVVRDTSIDDEYTIIDMDLYERKSGYTSADYFNKIHSKSILIYKDRNGNYHIDEQVDKIKLEKEEEGE